jgi:hypothetical protein
MMRNNDRLIFGTGLLVVVAVIMGCAPKQVATFPEDMETTCIQGTVRYLSPVDSTPVGYPNATITVWLHEVEKAIIDTKTDKSGIYCIEVPLGDFKIDLRVWGMIRLAGNSYICNASKDMIDLGQTAQKCGGDCMRIEIDAECTKFYPKRYRGSR